MEFVSDTVQHVGEKTACFFRALTQQGAFGE